MNWGAGIVGLATVPLFLGGCHKTPEEATAPQVMDQCQLSGAGKAPPSDKASLSYVLTCMHAAGWTMSRSSERPDCAGDITKLVNGVIVDPPHYNDPGCYRRTTPQGPTFIVP